MLNGDDLFGITVRHLCGVATNKDMCNKRLHVRTKCLLFAE